MNRRLYSYNDMPVVKRYDDTVPKATEKKTETVKQNDGLSGLFGNLENDDIILLVVFVILIMDSCEDRLLLLALAFVFFSDYLT